MMVRGGCVTVSQPGISGPCGPPSLQSPHSFVMNWYRAELSPYLRYEFSTSATGRV